MKISDKHSPYSISRALRLSYTDLKHRIEKFHATIEGDQSRGGYRYNPDPVLAVCIVEMDHRNGNKLRIDFKVKADIDLQFFAEAFWSGEG